MKLTKQPPKKITLYYEKVFSTWGIGCDFCKTKAPIPPAPKGAGILGD
jgi:hypothetical protein